MQTSRAEHRGRATRLLVAAVLLSFVHTLSATTYMSVEPVPNENIVGADNLALIRGIGYANLERWSERLRSECLAVDGVIGALGGHGAVTKGKSTNNRFVVAAGGLEGAQHQLYVAQVLGHRCGVVSN